MVSDLGTNVVRVRTLVWNNDGTNSFLTNQVSETSVEGLTTWNAAFGLTNLSRTGVGGQGFAASQTAYGYDNASRLDSASDGTYSAAYSYLANSPLIGQVLFQQSSTTRMTASKQYDYLNRLSAVVNTPAGPGQRPVSFSYGYNAANQRTNTVLGDPTYWTYQYDSLGQTTNGTRYWVDGTPVAGEQFQYLFDDIGNRRMAWWGGDSSGSNLRCSTNTVNLLNQYTQRDLPGTFDVLGAASSNATVTVNGSSPYRKSEFYRQELAVTNTAGPVYLAVTEQAVQGTQTNTAAGSVFVPQTPEAYTYDADGNLLSDGRWTYTWDGENRLVGMTGLTNLPSTAFLQLSFVYDANSRRVQKAVSAWNGSAYAPQSTNVFLYDGWNLLAELNGANNAAIRTYLWGPDLSGSMQRAGGVGGLLEVKPAGGDALFAAFDGNGNVAALIDATSGTNMVQYGYGPFGEMLQKVPGTNNPCPFRFSTKYTDDESDLVYYGYRYYNPSTGRWPSMDPLGESGFSLTSHARLPHNHTSFANYTFVLNNPNLFLDSIGLCALGQTKGLKCIPIAIPYGLTPDQKELAEAAGKYVGTLENAENILAAAGIAASYSVGGIEEALSEAAGEVLGESTKYGNPDKIAEELYNTIFNNSSTGYSAFTKVTWNYCDPGFCWNSWKLYDTGWLRVNEGGENDRGLFQTAAQAFAAAGEECGLRLSIYEKNTTVQAGK